MWCTGKSYSCEQKEIEFERDGKLPTPHINVNINSDTIFETLFYDPPKAVEEFVDYCKNALYNSQLGKLFRTLREGIMGERRERRGRGTSNRVVSSKSDKQDDQRHVMFADSLGLDLELIHTIQINNQASDELDKLITKQTFFNSYNNNLVDNTNNINHQLNNTNSDKLIVPRFILSPDRNYEKLIKNGICLNTIEIYNQSSLRGVILTLTKSGAAESSSLSSSSTANHLEDSKSTHGEEKCKLVETDFKKKSSKNSIRSKKSSNLDIVYIIWSVDDWTTWKYQAAIKNNCRTLRPNKGIIKTYEFFLQNLDLKLQVGQTLQLIICHQTDLVVYKDTNNEECYKFECAIKV